MEESLIELEKIIPQNLIPMNESQLRTYSPLAFAYIGDSIYDLIIRTMIVSRGNNRADRYHHEAIKYVNANAQMKMYQTIKDILTEEEQTIFRRGKNSKPASTAKNQSLHDYKIATGFEALYGYLFLAGKMDRILELTEYGLKNIDL